MIYWMVEQCPSSLLSDALNVWSFGLVHSDRRIFYVRNKILMHDVLLHPTT